MRSLEKHSEQKTIKTKDGDLITYDEFSAGNSKLLIDEIDTILAKHYGFTEEELDFVLNYDIKYRLGLGRNGAADDEDTGEGE